MQEKLSVKKIYRNAYRYVMSHLFGFAFLTVFYFLGSLLPMLCGAASSGLVSLIGMYLYTYLFFYFAAGFYFKQQFLWNKRLFLRACVRFLTAVVLFLSSFFISSLVINIGIYILNTIFGEAGAAFVAAILGSPALIIAKMLYFFFLFVVLFIVPSFTFVSEITGKSRSLMMAYGKTKGNLMRIGAVAALALVLLLAFTLLLAFVPMAAAALPRAAVLAFISILYFKMYDFFYNFPAAKHLRKPMQETEETLLEQAGSQPAPAIKKSTAAKTAAKANTPAIKKKTKLLANQTDASAPTSPAGTAKRLIRKGGLAEAATPKNTEGNYAG